MSRTECSGKQQLISSLDCQQNLREPAPRGHHRQTIIDVANPAGYLALPKDVEPRTVAPLLLDNPPE